MIVRTTRFCTSIMLHEDPDEIHDFNGAIWGFPKISGTFLGVPMRRTIAFWGLYWGPCILGNYNILLVAPCEAPRVLRVSVASRNLIGPEGGVGECIPVMIHIIC